MVTIESRLGILNNVITHVHSRLDNLLSQEERVRECEKHDGQVTISALYKYLTILTNNNELLVVDTDHPVHVLDRYGITREGRFSQDSIRNTIRLMSKGILERSQLIRANTTLCNILTGVEVDILNPQGELDINNSTLSQLDIVVASLHYNIWKASNNRTPPTKGQIIDALVSVSRNPLVDIIGHPVREIQPKIQQEMQPEDWDIILQSLIHNRVAFEINLSHYGSESYNQDLEKQIIKRGASKGVLFTVGLDFHTLSQYGSNIQESELIDDINLLSIINRNKGMNNYRLLRKLTRAIESIEQLGVSSSQIVNSTKPKFLDWLASKHQLERPSNS